MSQSVQISTEKSHVYAITSHIGNKLEMIYRMISPLICLNYNKGEDHS